MQRSNVICEIPLQIDRLKAEQADDVADLVVRNLGVFEDVGSVLASAFRRTQNILNTYAQDGAVYFVLTDARHPQQILGGAGIGPLHGLPASEGIGEIRELVIDDRYRGKGLGKHLLAHCLEQAHLMGYSRIYLETTPQMVHARHLFENFGFRPIRHAPASQKKSKDVQEDFACYYLKDEALEARAPKRSSQSKDRSV
jgi:N-acetylglutamate synthase-like GNAT family acetyltransferase